MNKTQNYQLNQWEADDRVLRTDFNADNAKIDAAIKAEATALAARVTALETKSRFTKLSDQTLTSSSTGYTINVGWIDWSRWSKVHLDIKANVNQLISMYLNSSSGSSLPVNIGTGDFAPRITFHVGNRANRYVSVTQAGYSVIANFTFSSLNQLIFTKGNFHSGAQLILWGEE